MPSRQCDVSTQCALNMFGHFAELLYLFKRIYCFHRYSRIKWDRFIDCPSEDALPWYRLRIGQRNIWIFFFKKIARFVSRRNIKYSLGFEYFFFLFLIRDLFSIKNNIIWLLYISIMSSTLINTHIAHIIYMLPKRTGHASVIQVSNRIASRKTIRPKCSWPCAECEYAHWSTYSFWSIIATSDVGTREIWTCGVKKKCTILTTRHGRYVTGPRRSSLDAMDRRRVALVS